MTGDHIVDAKVAFDEFNRPEVDFRLDSVGAKEFAELSGEEKVLDLYCGTGTIGLYLADQAKQVHGIDIVESAIENAKINAGMNNIKNVVFICGNIDKSLHDLLEKCEEGRNSCVRAFTLFRTYGQGKAV